jgi:hypothetical protein
MKEQLITPETAKLAKKVGFKIVTKYFYVINENDSKLIHRSPEKYEDYYENGKNHTCSEYATMPIANAPTQSLLQTWLRDKHKIQTCTWSVTLDKNKNFIDFYWSIKGIDFYLGSDLRDKEFDNYEDALEKCLQKALKLLKK